MKTKEGAKTHEHSLNHALEFFSKAGSLYTNATRSSRMPFYGIENESTAKELFINSFIVDPHLSMRLLFWLRDCRGGAGNRSGSQAIYTWLAQNYSDWIKMNMHFIPAHGRWSDLVSLFKTPLRKEAGEFWAKAIYGGDVLAAKWSKRYHKPTRKALGMKEAEFRKALSAIRKDHIVEHLMCQNQWEKVTYKTVPSVAMSRYTKAFLKHDELRFQQFKDAVKKGIEKVHAETLFPHDCIRTAFNGDDEMAELQFDALPNYMEDTDEKVMVICDTSGSMSSIISGSVEAVHVSMGMALYCSSRLPEDSPFYKRFIAFCSEGKFVDWRKHSFRTALKDRKVFDGAVGSTRIDKALDLILKIAVQRDIDQSQMPTTLLIVSDMQFHQGTHHFPYDKEAKTLTEVDKAMIRWDEKGYQRCKVVYWNTAGYQGSQDTINSENVGMVSGFSPSICKAIFSGDDFSPMAVMMRAIEKYECVIPPQTKEG